MMNAVNEPGVKEIVFRMSAQVGKTEIINNIIAYFIHQDPAPMLLIQPTLEMAEAWSKDRLTPMIRDTTALSELIDIKSRDSGNTLLHKLFPGGHITMAGANSPSSLASRPVRVVLLDEESRYPVSAGSEGDPGSLAQKRSTTFWNRLLVAASTPTIEGLCKITARYELSDQRRYYVKCKDCHAEQTLEWGNLHFDKNDPDGAHYVCAECGSVWNNSDKPALLAGGEWKATKPFSGIAGFHINELYSPWVTWPEMVKAFLKAKRLPETLKTWVNTALGDTWQDEGEGVEHEGLLKRKENWGKKAPEGVVVVTAGVDVQDDRLEVEIVGWGLHEESWSLQYHVLHGDPALKGVWQELDTVLNQRIIHESGVQLNINCACVDSGGHHTQAVYDFCKKRQVRRVFAIKGANTPGKPLVGRFSRSNARRVKLFPVGSDTAKEMVYSRLRITEPGPGYCHFPSHYTEDYFKQLTAERVVIKYRKGHPTRVWEKPSHQRNEALDCRVYALAALYILNPNFQKIGQDIEEEALNMKPKEDDTKQSHDSGGWLDDAPDFFNN